MPCWSHRSETGVCSRRWSRSMATFSGTLKRFRVFLDMGKPPLEIVAYSSALFLPFRLKQNSIEVGEEFLDLGDDAALLVERSKRNLGSPHIFQVQCLASNFMGCLGKTGSHPRIP